MSKLYNIRQYPSGGGRSIDLGNHTLEAGKALIQGIEAAFLEWQYNETEIDWDTLPEPVQYLESCDFSTHDIETDEIVADYDEHKWELVR